MTGFRIVLLMMERGERKIKHQQKYMKKYFFLYSVAKKLFPIIEIFKHLLTA